MPNQIISSLYVRVSNMISTLGNNPEAYCCAIDAGFTQVKPQSDFALVVGDRDYSSGIMLSQLDGLQGMSREQRIQLLLSEIEINTPTNSVLLTLIPDELSERVLKSLSEVLIDFTHIKALASDTSLSVIIEKVSSLLNDQGYDSVMLLTADSLIDFNTLFKAGQSMPLADNTGLPGLIPGEAAVLLELSKTPLSNSVKLKSIVGEAALTDNKKRVKSIRSSIQQLLLEMSESAVAMQKAGIKHYDSLVVDNPAFGAEVEWHGIRMNLSPAEKRQLPKLPLYPTRQHGFPGVTSIWLCLAYLQGKRDFPFTTQPPCLLIDATQKHERNLLLVEIEHDEQGYLS